jgi:hypothetical protein
VSTVHYFLCCIVPLLAVNIASLVVSGLILLAVVRRMIG